MNHSELIEFRKQYNIAQNKLRKEAQLKQCFHPDKHECTTSIVNAHSLQRQGALKILEKTHKGNSFIYSFTEREHNPNGDFLDLKPIGRRQASTFFGFCSKHDTELFSPIENEPNCTDIDSDYHCFLHSFRSFAHSYHRKKEEQKLFNTEDKEIISLLKILFGNLDANKQGVELAIKDFQKPKQKLYDILKNKKYDGLEYLAFEFNYPIPIACAASTTPNYTPSGKAINVSTDPDYEYSDIITTVIPFEERSVVILAAFADEPNGVQYLDEIEELEGERLEKVLTFHIMNNAENTYLSPIYYDIKPLNWKKQFCHFLNIVADRYTPILKYNYKFPYNLFAQSS